MTAQLSRWEDDIEGQAGKANKQLEKFISKLKKVSGSLNDVSGSMNTLSEYSFMNIDEIGEELKRKWQALGSENAVSYIKSFAEPVVTSIGEVVNVFNGMTSFVGKVSKFKNDLSNLSKLGETFKGDDSLGGIGTKIKESFSGIWSSLEGIGAKLGIWIGNVVKLFTGLDVTFAIPAAGVLAGLIAIVAGIIDLWRTSETFRDNVKNMMAIIGNAFIIAKELIWDNGLKPLWDSIKELFASLYQLYEESGLKLIFEGIITFIGYIASILSGVLVVALGAIISFIANFIREVVEDINTGIQILFTIRDGVIEIFKAITDFLENVVTVDFSTQFGFIGEILNIFFETVKGIFDSFKRIFGGICEFLSGVFTADWSRAWEGIKEIVGGILDGIIAFGKGKINFFITLFEGMANAIIKAFNSVKKLLNKFKIKIPDWVPELGGKELGFNLKMTPEISLPRLSKGGILNMGQLFLARENGPELVGRFGSKSAVMNNGQLLDSVRNSLKQDFSEIAMEVAAQAAMSANNIQQPANVIVTLQGETGQIFKVVQKEARKYERNYMRPAFE